MLIIQRFRVLRNDQQKNYFCSQCDNFQGLVGVVIEILKVEAGLHENEGNAIYDFVQVIDEELIRRGVPPVVRYGRFKGVGDYRQQATRPPEL